MKLDGEIAELKQWDAIRVPPGTWRVTRPDLMAWSSWSSARPFSGGSAR